MNIAVEMKHTVVFLFKVNGKNFGETKLLHVFIKPRIMRIIQFSYVSATARPA